MKKTHRTVLSILLALTLLASLPLTAMAETKIDNNTETLDDVSYGKKMENNTGTIINNRGKIENNGVEPEEGQPVDPSSGTVVSNQEFGKIKNNYGTVKANDPKGTNTPTISNNYGVVEKNITDTNEPNYCGKVQDNYGLVGKVVDGELDTSGTFGNSGHVGNNRDGGVVVNNKNGVVNQNDSAGDGTNPGVINNGGSVSYNHGTLENIAGQVHTNHGTVLNNYGTVGERPSGTDTPDEYNWGTVETNHISGWVTNNITGESGYGEGKVNTNYGTVYQVDKSNTWTYYYGLHGEDADTDTMYTEEGYSLGHEANTEVNLDEKAASYQREGYKLSSYTVWTYNKDSDATDKLVQQTVTDTTKYTINAPTLLKLVWDKIASVVKPASDGEAEVTSYNRNYIGLGSVVFINDKGYKVVEIRDDAYVVVTFDALPDEDVADLNALYARLFTPEQQKLVKNMGQLLDSEDVLTIFGKPGNHPVFEFQKDLVK